ncbi:MAG: OmpA family protein [Nitrospirota bacterium]|nr:OmpA family protein [Nitrospirota bacterium]
MVRRNLILLAAIAASSLFFGGCATTALNNLKTIQTEFSAIDRADGIKYAPMEYAQAEVNLHMANEECAEEAWLDLKQCEEFQGIARAKMDAVLKKIADARKQAPKKAEAPTPPPPPAPTPAPAREPAPVAPSSATPAVAPAPIETVESVKEEMRVIVHFDFDRSAIRKDAVMSLKEAIRFLKANPGSKVRIEGHTCSIGTNEYNMALADRRANSAKRYLVKKAGISPDRIETVAYGEEKPAKPNDTRKGRQYNRRAEVVVTK